MTSLIRSHFVTYAFLTSQFRLFFYLYYIATVYSKTCCCRWFEIAVTLKVIYYSLHDVIAL